MTRRLSVTELWAGALVLAAILPAPAALAAPFCLETATVPPQCIYYDANNCRKEAIHQGGGCVVNPAEIAVRPGTGEFCIAASNGATTCDYSDLQNCARDANRQGAVCVEAPPGAAGNVPDPYRYLTEPQTEGND